MIHHIRESCGLSSAKDTPITLFKDNATCIAKLQEATLQKIGLNTYELQKRGNVDTQQIRSGDKLIDLFTKVLPTSTLM